MRGCVSAVAPSDGPPPLVVYGGCLELSGTRNLGGRALVMYPHPAPVAWPLRSLDHHLARITVDATLAALEGARGSVSCKPFVRQWSVK